MAAGFKSTGGNILEPERGHLIIADGLAAGTVHEGHILWNEFTIGGQGRVIVASRVTVVAEERITKGISRINMLLKAGLFSRKASGPEGRFIVPGNG